MSWRCLGIVSIPDREKSLSLLVKLINWLLQRSIAVYLDDDTSALIPEGFCGAFSHSPLEELPKFVDLIIVLGGDGTLLRVARQTGMAKVPLLGVNLGGLGFLTDIHAERLFPILEEIINGQYILDERMMLQATLRETGVKNVRSTYALNDIVIHSGPRSRLINLATYIDSQWINTFLSDGLIVATPTGSTAYSLSAGGPIIHPGLHAILITPICPHILTNRPIVIPDKGTIRVEAHAKGKGKDEECLISADGEAFASLQPGDFVEVRKAPHTIKLLQPKGNDYYQVLRTKLKWGERG